MRTPRGLLVALGTIALAIAALQGLTGLTHMAFYAGPFLLVLGLLLSGRFIGEQKILARRAPRPQPKPRPTHRRRPPVHELPLASLLERSVRSLRGPPAASSCAA